MLNLLLTPEALPITTVGLFLMLCAVGWSIKTLFVELKGLIKNV